MLVLQEMVREEGRRLLPSFWYYDGWEFKKIKEDSRASVQF